jgi:hypothetical protein
MKIEFEDHKARLIINPDYDDLKALEIIFTEEVGGSVIENVKLLYLAQSESLHYNTYCTHILYEKNDELFTFSSGVNPDTNEFEIFNFKQSKEEYFSVLDSFDEDYEDSFFSVIHKEQQYYDLKEEFAKNDISIEKRIKI